MNTQLKVTGDGSHTLWVPHLNESYHSLKGALGESRYVFITQGLQFALSAHNVQTLNVLEVGLGTGLNAWLTMLFASEVSKKVRYTALEPYPLDMATVRKLNYPEMILGTEGAHLFHKIHETAWREPQKLSPWFTLIKHRQKIQEYRPESQFEAVYFDAFAPGKQPDIWALEVLRHVKELMSPGGILVTYCAQGQFKRDLKFLGFEVQTLAGPPGKKEMTRAIRG